jgi:hypothetical protein
MWYPGTWVYAGYGYAPRYYGYRVYDRDYYRHRDYDRYRDHERWEHERWEHRDRDWDHDRGEHRGWDRH